jgi:hypothetical protein
MEQLLLLVNEWGDIPRERAGNRLSPYPALETFLDEWPEGWGLFGGARSQDLVAVANRAYELFAAKSGGELAELLTHLLADARIGCSWEARDWAVHEVWSTDIHQLTQHPDRAMLAAVALTLVEHVRAHPDGSRLGTCNANACADAFVDHSPAGLRRYCSVPCQNRQRARVYRAGVRAIAERGGPCAPELDDLPDVLLDDPPDDPTHHLSEEAKEN